MKKIKGKSYLNEVVQPKLPNRSRSILATIVYVLLLDDRQGLLHCIKSVMSEQRRLGRSERSLSLARYSRTMSKS